MFILKGDIINVYLHVSNYSHYAEFVIDKPCVNVPKSNLKSLIKVTEELIAVAGVCSARGSGVKPRLKCRVNMELPHRGGCAIQGQSSA